MKITVIGSMTALVLVGSTENQPPSLMESSANSADSALRVFAADAADEGSLPWMFYLQHLHAKESSTSAISTDSALRVFTADAADEGSLPWMFYLQHLHAKGSSKSANSADSALRVFAADAADEGSLPWMFYLQHLHANDSSKTVDSEPSVRYLEFFKDQHELIGAMQSLAKTRNASIHVTDTAVFGKKIAKYLADELVPNDAILASCHNPEDCELQPETCDKRFTVPRPPDWKPQKSAAVDPAGHPLPFCHSPPSDTHMVYALTQFEDGQMDWLMFACHFMTNGGDMCHVADMIVADDATLESIRMGATLV